MQVWLASGFFSIFHLHTKNKSRKNLKCILVTKQILKRSLTETYWKFIEKRIHLYITWIILLLKPTLEGLGATIDNGNYIASVHRNNW
jgi:hypothetical protein